MIIFESTKINYLNFDTAFLGQISPDGKIVPVFGLTEKFMAAIKPALRRLLPELTIENQ
uniref:Uncharacterized protein n=1 Tax=Meloidogyne incognita TaxID=6306 RepID=A0A914LV68_MELIC